MFDLQDAMRLAKQIVDKKEEPDAFASKHVSEVISKFNTFRVGSI